MTQEAGYENPTDKRRVKALSKDTFAIAANEPVERPSLTAEQLAMVASGAESIRAFKAEFSGR